MSSQKIPRLKDMGIGSYFLFELKKLFVMIIGIFFVGVE